jgi:hypothetical protein
VATYWVRLVCAAPGAATPGHAAAKERNAVAKTPKKGAPSNGIRNTTAAVKRKATRKPPAKKSRASAA